MADSDEQARCEGCGRVRVNDMDEDWGLVTVQVVGGTRLSEITVLVCGPTCVGAAVRKIADLMDVAATSN